jgi:hypothetical protein
MSAPVTVHPAGYAATGAEFLDEAAADGDRKDLAVRQLAALQAIGYALLALGGQIADAADAAVQCGGQVAEVASAVDGLYRAPHRAPLGVRARAALARLARRGQP